LKPDEGTRAEGECKKNGHLTELSRRRNKTFSPEKYERRQLHYKRAEITGGPIQRLVSLGAVVPLFIGMNSEFLHGDDVPELAMPSFVNLPKRPLSNLLNHFIP
jgi:hypothetical protein